jgi:hypothetical protein
MRPYPLCLINLRRLIWRALNTGFIRTFGENEKLSLRHLCFHLRE